MSKAARSVQLFGFYLLALGTALMVAPNLVLAPFGFAPPQEVWIRVLGVVVLLLGSYYVVAAKAELTVFFRHSVIARATVPFFFAALVALHYTGPAILAFAAFDLIGAAWTHFALRAQPVLQAE